MKIPTGLVDTYSTPIPPEVVAGRRPNAGRFVTHHFALTDTIEAYDVLGHAADTAALRIVLTNAA